MLLEHALRVVVVTELLAYVIHSPTVRNLVFHYLGGTPDVVCRDIGVDVDLLREGARGPTFDFEQYGFHDVLMR